MQAISTIWGIFAVIGTAIAFIPCLGWLNWINIPFAFLGFILSGLSFASASADDRGGATSGLILCGSSVFFGLIRLIMGGGIF